MKSIGPRLVLWIAALAVLAFLYGGWVWFIERIEVPPGKVLVRIHYWGKDLEENQLVAPDESYKGVMLDVGTTGRYFLNPLIWGYELHDVLDVKSGECVVVTRRFGTDIPKDRVEAGDFLAREGDPAKGIAPEKGIMREVLLPGSKFEYSNPYAYSIQRVPAVEVKVDQVGVKTLRVGKNPKDVAVELGKGLYVVPEGYRGVQKEIVRSGTYYLNPYVETISPVGVRSQKVDFGDIVFPSRDGFMLKPHVLVEYAVIPEKAPEVLVRISDFGQLHQKDTTQEDKDRNEILQKVILPHIRGYARIEGSNFDARDFIMTSQEAGGKKGVNAREALQKALEAKVKPMRQELGIQVRAVTLASMDPPERLKELISDREQARVEQEKLKAELGQLKTKQSLEATRAMEPRAEKETQAKTKLLQESKLAEQRKEVEEQRLKQALENAELRLQAARKEAEAIIARGKADAAVINSQNDADVAGLRKAVQGFNGVQNFAQYHVISKLAPALSEIFASDDSEIARLVMTYSTAPPAAKPPAPAPAPAPVAPGRN